MSNKQNGSKAVTPSPERLGSEEHPLEQMKRVLICELYSESHGNCPRDTAEHMKQWERDAIMHFHCDPMFNAKVQFMSHAVMNCAKRFFAPNNDFQVNKENMKCSTES